MVLKIWILDISTLSRAKRSKQQRHKPLHQEDRLPPVMMLKSPRTRCLWTIGGNNPLQLNVHDLLYMCTVAPYYYCF